MGAHTQLFYISKRKLGCQFYAVLLPIYTSCIVKMYIRRGTYDVWSETTRELSNTEWSSSFFVFFLNWNNAFGTNRLRHEKVTCAYPYHTTHSTPLPGHTLLSHTPEYMHYENMPIQIY